jgi:Cytidylate kinase
MISTVSGSQGQGKSAVLNVIDSMGYNVVEQKTSRSILADWGLTLDQVNRYPPLTIRFQEEIIRRHSEAMKPYVDSSSLYFMERSFADIFVYALMAVGSFNEYNNWMEDYWHRCMEEQEKFHTIYYLTGRTFVPVDDGVRSTNRFFGELVDREIAIAMKRMDDEIGKKQLLNISYTDLDQRVHTVLTHCCGV